MISLFRKIRKSLIHSGSAKKYFFYALGEIALVMIGILLALQVNKWNGNRINLQKESELLKALIFDMAGDTLYYDSRKSNSENIIQTGVASLDKMYQKQEDIEEAKSLINSIVPTLESRNLLVENSTYTQIMNAGELNLIRSASLRKQILDYYKAIEGAADHIKEFNLTTTYQLPYLNNMNHFAKFLKGQPFSFLYNDSSKWQVKDWIWINDAGSEEFYILETTIHFYLAKNNAFIGHFNTLKLLATELITAIEKEIK